MPKFKSKFKENWKKEFPFISVVEGDDHKVLCSICASTFSISSGGLNSIRDHVKSARHKSGQSKLVVNHKIDDFFPDYTKLPTSQEFAITAKELAFAFHSGKHRSSVRTSECTSSLVAMLFEPKFSSAKTKSSKLVQKVKYYLSLKNMRAVNVEID